MYEGIAFLFKILYNNIRDCSLYPANKTLLLIYFNVFKAEVPNPWAADQCWP